MMGGSVSEMRQWGPGVRSFTQTARNLSSTPTEPGELVARGRRRPSRTAAPSPAMSPRSDCRAVRMSPRSLASGTSSDSVRLNAAGLLADHLADGDQTVERVEEIGVGRVEGRRRSCFRWTRLRSRFGSVRSVSVSSFALWTFARRISSSLPLKRDGERVQRGAERLRDRPPRGRAHPSRGSASTSIGRRRPALGDLVARGEPSNRRSSAG